MIWGHVITVLITASLIVHCVPVAQERQHTGRPNKPRQVGAIAALSPLLIPLAATVVGPVATQRGSGLANVFTSFFRENRTSLTYDAYMVNVPGSPTPHLYLLPHVNDVRATVPSRLQAPGVIRPLQRRLDGVYKGYDIDTNKT